MAGWSRSWGATSPSSTCSNTPPWRRSPRPWRTASSWHRSGHVVWPGPFAAAEALRMEPNMSTLEDSSLRLRRQRTLRVLLTAEFMSMLGTQLSAVGMPWLVLQLTGSLRDMGLVMAAQLAAIAVFGVFGASLVGRMGPRRVMLVGDTVRGPLVALLPLLYYLGWLNIGVFIVVMFAVGAFYAPY